MTRAIGAASAVLDEIRARTAKHARLPPLGVGLGIYLPTSTTLMVVVGAIVFALTVIVLYRWLFRRARD